MLTSRSLIILLFLPRVSVKLSLASSISVVGKQCKVARMCNKVASNYLGSKSDYKNS